MPYGVKRGIKTPGDFGVTDYAGLSLAGAAGIVAALVTDYQQSGEAAALFTINQWAVSLGSLLGFGDIPLYVVALAIIAAGAGSIFYFQPITRQGAFAQGFGLLAVLMTAVPADFAGGIEAMRDDLQALPAPSDSGDAALDLSEAILPASFSSQGEARVVDVQAQAAARYNVILRIRFRGGIPDDIESLIRRGQLRGRLHNSDTDQTFNLFRSAGGRVRRDGDSIVIEAGIPARSSSATLWVRVEAAGHRIEQQSAQASLSTPLNWTIDLEPSDTPLFIQRLNQSYWF